MTKFKKYLNESSGDAQERMLMILIENYFEKINKDPEVSSRAEISRLAFVNDKICFDAKLKTSKTEAITYSFEIDMVKKH